MHDPRSVSTPTVRCRCLDLDTLIQVKRAAGPPKDLDAIAELEKIRELQDGQA